MQILKKHLFTKEVILFYTIIPAFVKSKTQKRVSNLFFILFNSYELFVQVYRLKTGLPPTPTPPASCVQTHLYSIYIDKNCEQHLCIKRENTFFDYFRVWLRVELFQADPVCQRAAKLGVGCSEVQYVLRAKLNTGLLRPNAESGLSNQVFASCRQVKTGSQSDVRPFESMQVSLLFFPYELCTLVLLVICLFRCFLVKKKSILFYLVH